MHLDPLDQEEAPYIRRGGPSSKTSILIRSLLPEGCRRLTAVPPPFPQHLHHHTILGRRGEDLGHGGEDIYITIIIIYAATIDPLVVILDLVVDSFVYSYYYSSTIHMIASMMSCASIYE